MSVYPHAELAAQVGGGGTFRWPPKTSHQHSEHAKSQNASIASEFKPIKDLPPPPQSRPLGGKQPVEVTPISSHPHLPSLPNPAHHTHAFPEAPSLPLCTCAASRAKLSALVSSSATKTTEIVLAVSDMSFRPWSEEQRHCCDLKH